MAGDWQEAKHPRAADGKFGEGSGGAAASPAGQRAKRATPAARAKIAAARAKASAKAKKIVADARMKAKATVLAAAVKREETVAKVKASGRKLTPKQRERISAARTKAKAKAADIIAKAKAKAAATLKGKRAAPLQSTAAAGKTTRPSKTKKATEPQHPEVVVGLHKSWAVGDLTGGRTEMQLYLEKQGFSQNSAQHGNAADGVTVRLDPNLRPGIQAQRNWNGVVDIQPAGADLLAQLDGHKAEPGRGFMDPVVNQVRVMWHEQLHGFGPGTMATYTGHGVTVEEISTEMSARRLSRDLHGFDLRDGSAWQPYSALINPLQRKIAAAHGITHDQAWDVLERAAMAYKKRPAGSVSDLVGALAEDIERAGPKKGVRGMFEAELRSL